MARRHQFALSCRLTASRLMIGLPPADLAVCTLPMDRNPWLARSKYSISPLVARVYNLFRPLSTAANSTPSRSIVSCHRYSRLRPLTGAREKAWRVRSQSTSGPVRHPYLCSTAEEPPRIVGVFQLVQRLVSDHEDPSSRCSDDGVHACW